MVILFIFAENAVIIGVQIDKWKLVRMRIDFFKLTNHWTVTFLNYLINTSWNDAITTSFTIFNLILQKAYPLISFLNLLQISLDIKLGGLIAVAQRIIIII